MDELIEKIAFEYGLDPDLVRAIVKVESGGDPWAVRYEPGFYRTYVLRMLSGRLDPPKPAGVSRATEARLRSCSFGLMQVMGQVARERGFEKPFLTELCDPATGLRHGCFHLKFMLDRYLGETPRAVAAYNAGSARVKGGRLVNQDYVDKVLVTLSGLKSKP